MKTSHLVKVQNAHCLRLEIVFNEIVTTQVKHFPFRLPRLSVHRSVCLSVCLCVRKITQFPAVVSQNVTKKGAWYVLGVTLGHPHTPVGPLLPRQSRGAYIKF